MIGEHSNVAVVLMSVGALGVGMSIGGMISAAFGSGVALACAFVVSVGGMVLHFALIGVPW